ncbi:hypothetical protein ACFLTN_06500 [Chloroflexota bacterium]
MKAKLLSLLLVLALVASFPAIPVQAQTSVTADDIQDAIDDGVAWLAEQQNIEPNVNPGDPDYGSWGDDWPIGETALVLVKLQDYAWENSDFDPDGPFHADYLYKQNVEAGLNYLFAHAWTTGISEQIHDTVPDDPDSHKDGDEQDDTGVRFGDDSNEGGYDIYVTSVCMMAIAASRAPDKKVSVSGSDVDGWTYKEVLCNAVDYIAYSQSEGSSFKPLTRGGWGYYANHHDEVDNSNSGYAVIGLQYAESPLYGFCCTIPKFVREELGGKEVSGSITPNWIDYIQDDVSSGSGYCTPLDETVPINCLKTGNLLSEMAFVGDKENTQRVQDALDYIQGHWHDPDYTWIDNSPNDTRRGWGYGGTSPAFYQAAYCLMRGLQSMGIADDYWINSAPVIKSWYQDLADVIVLQRNSDGSWPDSPREVKMDETNGAPLAGQILSTVWALLTLERSAPPGPCECQGWDPVTVSWTDANGNPGTWTGQCTDTTDTLTISSVTAGTVVEVSTSEDCTFGCAASENWTVTSSQGMQQGDGATATFTPAGCESYTVTFNATCSSGGASTACSPVSENISCPPCTIVISTEKPVAMITANKTSVCPGQTVKLTGSVDPSLTTATYHWTGPNIIEASYLPSGYNVQSPLVDTTGMSPGTYTYSLTVKDNGPCDSLPDDFTIEVLPRPTVTADDIIVCPGDAFTLTCLASDDTLTYHWVQAWGLPPFWESFEQSPTVNTTGWETDYYDEYIHPYMIYVNNGKCEGKAMVNVIVYDPFPPIVFTFEATPNVAGPPCVPNAAWNLHWHVLSAWPPPGYAGTLTSPIYISLKCTDISSNNVETLWGPTELEPHGGCNGSYSMNLPSNFDPVGKKCEFCLLAYNRCGDSFTKCIPICDNVTCPTGCECVSLADEQQLGYKPANQCSPSHCRINGVDGHCYPVGGPNPCPPGCKCVSLDDEIALGLESLDSSHYCCQTPTSCRCHIGGGVWGHCYPVEGPGPVINSFTVVPAPSFGGACIPGAPWSLSWDVDVPNTQIAWPAPGNSTQPVYIEFHCTDSNNNVQTYWGPEAFEQDGSYTYTLPADFQPCGNKCEFCLWTYDCNLNKVMQCKPMISPCPDNCVCTSPTNSTDMASVCVPCCPCNYDPYNNPMYCFPEPGPEPLPAPTPCPEECDCLTENEAIDRGYTHLCHQDPCSAPGEPEKFCYSRCPLGCYCVTEKEADERGYIISCSDEICDPTSKEPKYCFSPPVQPCSQRCQCLTPAQAKEYGYSDGQRCQSVPCKQDAQGKDMYCYPKPKAPVVDVTADRSSITAGEGVRVCWKAVGEGITEVMLSAAGGKPTPVDPQGCKDFRPTQSTRYLVTAKSPAGSGQDAVTVGVGQPPPVEKVPPPVEEEPPPPEVCPTIVSFTVNCPAAQTFTPSWAAELLLQPRPVAAASLPQTCTLSWMVTGPAGTTVSISGIGVGMVGSKEVERGAAPVTYTLTATYGTCTRTATVQVQ